MYRNKSMVGRNLGVVRFKDDMRMLSREDRRQHAWRASRHGDRFMVVRCDHHRSAADRPPVLTRAVPD